MAKRWGGLLGMLLMASTAIAATPAELVAAYAAQAGVAVDQIDAAAGEALYRQGGAGQKHCASCHTDDPRGVGKTRVGKRIEPMAPSVNPARFTDATKVEKWFGRNCKDVLERACTPTEKAAFVAWLSGIR